MCASRPQLTKVLTTEMLYLPSCLHAGASRDNEILSYVDAPLPTGNRNLESHRDLDQLKSHSESTSPPKLCQVASSLCRLQQTRQEVSFHGCKQLVNFDHHLVGVDYTRLGSVTITKKSRNCREEGRQFSKPTSTAPCIPNLFRQFAR